MDNKKCILLTLCCTPVFASAHIIGESHMNGKTNHAYDTNVADTSRVYDIDEIVVSSQPKDLQRLRRQAVSSTSLSAKTLAAFATRDMRDVATRVPSFVMPCYGSRYTSSVYVRGIGSRVNNPAIGMYVDDIPMVNKSAFNTHLYDLSRIDILRGPQGTLYGQNAEGGLVRVYTKSPLTYQGTDAKLSIGNHMWRMAQISHYNKVEGVGAYSLSAFYNGQNGFLRNQYNKHRADDGNEAGARLKFMLSLLPYMWQQIVEVHNIKMLVNYGMDEMRFGQPVITGSRVRLVTTLLDIQNLRGICKASIKFDIEIEGQRKPALSGIATFLYYFN